MDVAIDRAVPADLPFVDDLQRKNADALAFYPASALEREIEAGRILLAKVNGEPAGYLYHGALKWPESRIHQACIHYDLRGQLYGSELVRRFRQLCQSSGVSTVTLKCGSDLRANSFWEAMGFYCEAVRQGGVRRMREINCWRLDLGAPLFSTFVKPSEKQQDSSLWARRRVSADSQFIRGKAMRQYRAQVLNSIKRDKDA